MDEGGLRMLIISESPWDYLEVSQHVQKALSRAVWDMWSLSWVFCYGICKLYLLEHCTSFPLAYYISNTKISTEPECLHPLDSDLTSVASKAEDRMVHKQETQTMVWPISTSTSFMLNMKQNAENLERLSKMLQLHIRTKSANYGSATTLVDQPYLKYVTFSCMFFFIIYFQI